MTPEFIKHLMVCKSCGAAHSLYCSEGRVLKIRSDADYVVSLSNPNDSRKQMQVFKKNNPSMYVELCEVVRAMLEEKKTASAA